MSLEGYQRFLEQVEKQSVYKCHGDEENEGENCAYLVPKAASLHMFSFDPIAKSAPGYPETITHRNCASGHRALARRGMALASFNVI